MRVGDRNVPRRLKHTQLRMWVLAFVLVLTSVASTSRLRGQASEDKPTHGTINILLGNQSGMVLVTDSRSSDAKGRTINDKTQKLFQLDNLTICSIAGFGSNPGPSLLGNDGKRSRQLSLDAGSVILGFAQGLGKKNLEANPSHPVTFKQKVDSLSGRLALEISILQTENLFGTVGPPASDDEIDLLFAGFDYDGTQRMAKRIIKIRRNTETPDISSYVGQVSAVADKVIVGNKLQYLTSGYSPAALEVEKRLSQPTSYPNELPLRDFLSSERPRQSSLLTIKQIGELADHLERIAADSVRNSRAPVIGGPVQKAKVVSGKVTIVPIDLNKPPVLKGTAQIFNLHTKRSLYPFFGPPNFPIIYGNYTCEDAAIFLDNAIILQGKYDRCLFYYSGKPFYIDPNDVDIRDSFLVTSPDYPDQWISEVLKLLPGTTSKSLAEVQRSYEKSKPAPK